MTHSRAFLIFIAMLLAATTARAFDFRVRASSGQYVYYTITSSTTVKVDSPNWDTHTPPSGFLALPQTVEHDSVTYNVTAIASDAFRSCSDLTGVSVPEGVVSIGRMAFAFCTQLDSIVLPSTLTFIGSQAFTSTAYFRDSDRLTPEGLLYIGPYLIAAQRRPSDEPIVVAEGTLGLGNMAFYSCDEITTIVLPSSLLFIGDMAFQDCTILDTLYLLDTVPPTLGTDAFLGADSVTIAVPCNTADLYNAIPAWSALDLVEYCGGTPPIPPVVPDNPDGPINPYPVDPANPDLPDDPFQPDTPSHVSIDVAESSSPTVISVEGGIVARSQVAQQVTLFDMTGRTLASRRVEGECFLPLPRQGVYLVQFNGTTLKVVYIR